MEGDEAVNSSSSPPPLSSMCAAPWTGDVAAVTWNPRLHYYIQPGRQILSCDMAGLSYSCGQVATNLKTGVFLRIGGCIEYFCASIWERWRVCA